MQFNHVGISVSSLEQSIEFYRDKLGMEPMNQRQHAFLCSDEASCITGHTPSVNGGRCFS